MDGYNRCIVNCSYLCAPVLSVAWSRKLQAWRRIASGFFWSCLVCLQRLSHSSSLCGCLGLWYFCAAQDFSCFTFGLFFLISSWYPSPGQGNYLPSTVAQNHGERGSPASMRFECTQAWACLYRLSMVCAQRECEYLLVKAIGVHSMLRSSNICKTVSSFDLLSIFQPEPFRSC